ncbi:MAG TPA: type I phosphomannose isomerase catalytic subunit [Verrucomicrobiae bacterium]|jgi:mannose-6-phosphate isomerase|nr:type I phosphomannose isomerase catalytic subunit [Verrucomicrobiae bacterium]
MLYPLIFKPILKERIWGGRNLATLYGKSLPPGKPIGESWEISDRPGDESVIANGPLQGRTLGDVMRDNHAAMLGADRPAAIRFPLLVKIIDAQQTLSLQVHPPAQKAAELGGEPKTEMWYIAQAGPKAELYVGLQRGVDRAEFERKLASQTVADCFHRIPVCAGDAMFLPSGRVHALGADIVIFEIQQNSDTTYRVFDWNRVDAAGRPRDLHVAQSLASIDFQDFEPGLLPANSEPGHPGRVRPLVQDKLFTVSLRELGGAETLPLPAGRMEIIGVVSGAVRVAAPGGAVELAAGQFCLVPADSGAASVRADGAAKFLEVTC